MGAANGGPRRLPGYMWNFTSNTGLAGHAAPFTFPLRAITVDGAPNVLTAGKTIAMTFAANTAAREHLDEWSSGVGAGAAAAMMAARGWTSGQLLASVQELQARLRQPDIAQPLSWGAGPPPPPPPPSPPPPSPPPPGGRTFVCGAQRCFEASGAGRYTNSSCVDAGTGRPACAPLAPDEWLLLKGHWALAPNRTQAVARVDTRIKKSERPGGSLPPSEQEPVAKGTIRKFERPATSADANYLLAELSHSATATAPEGYEETTVPAASVVGSGGGGGGAAKHDELPAAEGEAAEQRQEAGGWSQSFTAGAYDSKGQLAGGSETLHLKGHGGSLFAATGYWEDTNNCAYSSEPNACVKPALLSKGWGQVLRLDDPAGEWEVDLDLGIGVVRTEALEELTFRTDATGQQLDKPATVLVAGGFVPPSWYLLAGAFVWVRHDDDATWRKTTVTKNATSLGSVRAISMHRDSVTGVDRCFVTVGLQGIYSGTWDPKGRTIAWDAQPEPSPTIRVRPLGQAEANGRLYFTSGQFLLQRQDGARPTWTIAHDFSIPGAPPPNGAIGGLRGLSRVPNPAAAAATAASGAPPSAPAPDSLLIIWANTLTNQGCMYRLDPDLEGGGGFTQHLEVCLAGLMSKYLDGTPVLYTLGAYNKALPLVDPQTNATVHMIGFLARIPCQGREGVCAERGSPGVGPKGSAGYYAGAVFFLRHNASTYKLNEVGGKRPYRASSSRSRSSPNLVAVRTYAASPFADEQSGRGGVAAVYFGGYDCNEILAPTNTAWVFRGNIETVLDPLCCTGDEGVGSVAV